MNYRHTDFMAPSIVSYVDKHNAATTKHCTSSHNNILYPYQWQTEMSSHINGLNYGARGELVKMINGCGNDQAAVTAMWEMRESRLIKMQTLLSLPRM